MVVYDIYFNSGTVNRNTHYSKGDNVSLVQISQSDQEYYQTGTIIVYNSVSSQNIGDSVMVLIDGSLEFDGYVSSRHRSLKGVVEDTYKLVGRTYDLWRYHTDENTSYSNKTTSYIASSLVGEFCIGVSGTNIDTETGVDVTDDIDFNNEIIGDALTRISNMDGFTFYVDNNGQLVYESPGDAVNMLNVQESDIIDMQPIEESDEDLINDVLVIGGSDYSHKTTQLLNDSSQCIHSGLIYAQRFRAESHTLSAIKAYLYRSLDPYQPSDIILEILENSEKKLFEDTFDNWDYLLSGNDNHWNMTVNDGYLQLDYTTQTQSLTIESPVYQNNFYYIGQTFEFPSITTAYKAGIWTRFSTLCEAYIEIRTCDAQDPPEPTSTVLCSGTVDITNYDYNYWEANLSPQILLEGGTRYAVIIHAKEVTRPKVYTGSEEYTNGSLTFSSVGVTYWISPDVGGEDIGFYVEGRGYAASGQIESICYSGQYTSEQSGYDCQFLKLDLQDMISSNYLFISGSHNSGGTWESLVDDAWYDFTSEDHAVKVKYIMSSNSTFTPKIGGAELKISDENAAFSTIVFDDPFDDYSYLSGASMFSSNVLDGLLQLTDYIDSGGIQRISGMVHASDDTLTDPSNMIDSDTNTYALFDVDDPSKCGYIYSWSSARNIWGFVIKLGQDGIRDYKMWIDNFWVSGLHTSGWEQVVTNKDFDNDYEIYDSDDDPDPHTIEIDFLDYNINYYKDLKKIKFQWTTEFEFSDTYGRVFDFYLRAFEDYPYSGSAKSSSNSITTKETQFLKVEPTFGEGDSAFTFSGSADSGSHWDKLVIDTNTEITYPGYYPVLWYNFKCNSDVYDRDTKWPGPYLENCKLTATGLQAGGLPKSGSKIEWSDDIEFTTNDVPYPASFTPWKSYSSPKLSGLVVDDYYWLTMQHGSSNNMYWKFYYDGDSEYDYGGMAVSWDDGVGWSSNSSCPLQVPAGDMCFELGWTEGDIFATATNQDSIDSFGRHFKKITDSNITSLEEAQLRADLEISGMLTAPKKGSLTINGTTDVDLTYKLSGTFVNFDISEKMDIVNYTQTIDNRGFTTQVTYGKRQFDLAKEVAELKRELG